VWRQFIERFHGLISGIVVRTVRRYTAPSTGLVEDLVQETYLKICADRRTLLKGFQFQTDDSAFGFLKVVTANVVHDHFKAVFAGKRGAGFSPESLEEHHAMSIAGPAGGSAEIERTLLLKELDGILQRCLTGENQHRDRNIFWLYYRHGLTAGAIARIPTLELTAKGVESTILRLTRLVRAELHHPPGTGTTKPTDISLENSF